MARGEAMVGGGEGPRAEAPSAPAGKGRPSAPRPPSVERLLAAAGPALGGRNRDAVVAEARRILDEERRRLRDGGEARDLVTLAGDLVRRLVALADPAISGLVPVINATGVILHTNLGRAPWPAAAVEAARRAAAGYVLLELDPVSGRRGRRVRAAEEHLIALTGAQDALVVNNNAAAVALACRLAGRRGIAVARGELVEIGGGVRIPEIVARAGARLVEVGTTNRTRLADFEAALASGRVSLVLRVHPSNFRLTGFVEAPDLAALAELAHRYDAIVVDDLGSGALLDTARYGLDHEPMPQERLAAGADLVTFSGDKLLGGPQAGLLVGRADLVERLRGDPLARAVRADKVTLAALAATLALYRAGLAEREIPVWQMLATDEGTLERRGREILARLQAEGVVAPEGGGWPRATVVPSEATVGGGSLPGEVLPSRSLAIAGTRGVGAGGAGDRPSAAWAEALARRLRLGIPSVVGRLEGARLLLDLRTIVPGEDEAVVAAVVAALRGIAAASDGEGGGGSR